MEQESKEKWYIDHFGDSNPYEELPKMNIYTYNLAEKYRYTMFPEAWKLGIKELELLHISDCKNDQVLRRIRLIVPFIKERSGSKSPLFFFAS